MSLFDRIIGPAGLAETVVKERGDEAWRDEHARGFTHGRQAAKDVEAKHGRILAHTNLAHLKKSEPKSHFDVGYLKGYKHHLGVHESDEGLAEGSAGAQALRRKYAGTDKKMQKAWAPHVAAVYAGKGKESLAATADLRDRDKLAFHRLSTIPKHGKT